MTGPELRKISNAAKEMVNSDQGQMLSAVYIMLAALILNEAQKADAHGVAHGARVESAA